MVPRVSGQPSGSCGKACVVCGLLSCLTLSGVTTEEQLLSPSNEITPDYYVDSIAQFM